MPTILAKWVLVDMVFRPSILPLESLRAMATEEELIILAALIEISLQLVGTRKDSLATMTEVLRAVWARLISKRTSEDVGNSFICKALVHGDVYIVVWSRDSMMNGWDGLPYVLRSLAAPSLSWRSECPSAFAVCVSPSGCAGAAALEQRAFVPPGVVLDCIVAWGKRCISSVEILSDNVRYSLLLQRVQLA